MHSVAPVSFWKLPASHGAHEGLRSVAANVPAAHADGAVAPSAQLDPGGQSSHCACPGCRWNVPAAQRVHVGLAAAAYEPSAHGVGTREPVGHATPASHSTQSVGDARLVALP